MSDSGRAAVLLSHTLRIVPNSFVTWILALWATVGMPARAQPTPSDVAEVMPAPRATLSAVRVATPPVIDGTLDDEVWSGAAASDAFTQVDPVEGAAPTERTEIRVLFDADAIYVGVRCFDRDAKNIRAKQMQRDASQLSDDTVTIVIDPFLEKRDGYFFQIGAAGGKREGLIEGARQRERDEWDAIWVGRVTRDDEGWTAEIAIPLKSISFRADATAWGFNIERTIRRKQEIVRWTGARRTTPLRNLGEAGELRGLSELRQGLGLTLQPYLSARFNLDEGGVEIKPGADIIYKLSPSITAAFTINTDFAETEVDDRRVNLTRFPLFFPEKRDFFLQDAQIFSFGGINSSPLPYFSRRIGIVRGQQKDILAGVKVTGREGGVSFGALNVQMAADGALGDKNLSVARVSADVLDQSTAGIIFTRGDPDSRGDNALLGADFNYRTSSFMGSRNLEANAWVMGSFTSPDAGRDESDSALGGRISFPNDDWGASVFAGQIGEEFDPALGFVERRGVREYVSSLRRRWRSAGSEIRRVEVTGFAEVFTTLQDRLQSYEFNLPEVEFETREGDVLDIQLEVLREVLDEDFEISDGVVIPTGGYSFNRFRGDWEGARSRTFAPRFGLGLGEFYDGNRSDLLGGVDWRPSAQVYLSGEYEHREIDLPAGDFIVRIMRMRANFIFTPEMSWNNTIQYDNASDQAGLNSRWRYEFRPGSEVFVVLNQGWTVDNNRFTQSTSELTLKLGLTFRF
jgi:hypothetical protein